jgi:DNA-binding NarL/FixJ family response regulator
LRARVTGGNYGTVVPKILVVDDSPQFRDVAAALLAERGIELLAEAADADQALHAAARACPDGILLDINLPDSDGFTVAAALAAQCPAARIVLTSADVAYVPAQLLADCAAIAFVPKEELAGTDLGALFTPAGI